ncbi:hypothetical protein L3X38_002575 [Prunus dulcis]|uniref:Uncharacterized protein n=1 Tax=Prunus dulcis TaxID=3755 RepID=A0AAD4ZL64_PRUDU|nr:hypothetical protein L3X38_002575 [Prunus dulcis]
MTVQSRYEERDNMKMCKFTRYDSRTSPASVDEEPLFDFFQKAYESLILPIPALGKGLGTNGSANAAVLPPITKRPTERPLMKRIKAFGEGTRPLKCSQCSVVGHNKKTCKAVI